MGRLFAGTPWDRPPSCEGCGHPEAECTCPPPRQEPLRIPPERQTARLRVEKRPKGKLVTVIDGLDPAGNDLAGLAARLKAACGTGGTFKEADPADGRTPRRGARIELQGNHLERAEAVVAGLGYRTRRG